ncbi:hypothetical protein MGN70_010727 [Eutypa lata]|uniref:Ubiquitin 3 binding protein But2 C-terminal domain-containing protein n=1 Tax=Eutypa lata (strain UCR-EL1) TaxID=1287681 RepID=M7SUL9_EUTLA|nr:hypothetical protein UCREL1_4769 [Eutypa lata UCREL1]KAI1246844.1 hypothetical protein MGN70_010727 [Eutypa lata]
MQFKAFILAALAGASAVSARTIKAPHSRRTVTTVGLPNPNFSVSKNLAAGIDVTSVQAFPVDLPATECTLFWQAQPGFHVTQSGSTQINVFSVDGNAPGALVGTFTINSFDGAPHDINTFECRDPLTVRFEIASDEQPGSVSFTANGASGIFLEYTH